MAKIQNPHIAFPFSLNASGTSLRTREQGSDDEIEDKLQVLLGTEIGSRQEVPEYGIKDQAFRQGGAQLEEIAAAIKKWEPRADSSLERLQELSETLTDNIQVKTEGHDG